MNKFEPILKEIASGLLEVAEIKPNFSNDALLDATLIFQSVFMDKFYNKYKNYTLETQEHFAVKAGNRLRELIIDFTNLDTHELTKNYGK